eukprot:Em0002g660a
MIGRFEDGTLARCIIVQGIPGVGKSTLAWQLGRRWGKKEILQHFQLVIVLRLRDERVQKAHTISELLYHPNKVIQQPVVEWMGSTLGEDVLLILDGYDELSSELQIGDQSIFARIINGKELPKLTVLVTSRPSANRNLYQLCRIRAKCQYIEVVGFSKKKIREYVELAFEHNLQLKESFNLYINHRPHIRSMMYVPINCAIVVELFREHKGKPPQTLTEVYTALTNTLLQRHEQKTKEKTPVGMPHTVSHELLVLKKHYSDLVGTIQDPAGLAGSLYSRGMICQSVRDKVQERVDLTIKEKARVLINAVEAQVTTDPSMFQVFMEVLKEEPSLSTIVERMSNSTVTSSKMTCFEGLSSTTLSQLQSVAKLAYQGTLNDQLIFHDVQDSIESLGLLQKVPQVFSTSSPIASYNFIHKTLQEFLTAWYVSSLPTSEQRVFMNDSLTKPNMAMTVRFMAGLTKFQTTSENMDALADLVISLENTDQQRLIECLHWMFETQNPTFIQRLMGYKEQTFECSETVLNPFDLHVFGYCIANSFTLWSVKLFACDLTNEGMRMLFLVEDGKAFDHITSFNLSYNTITASVASLLGMMLKENNTLKVLGLEGCELQPEELEEVIKGVQVNTKLETLDLKNNTIDNKRASCLGMMLKENNTLKVLNLGGCGLQPEGLEEVIKGVQVNTMLETVDLSGNTIDNKTASCLGMMLKENNTLKKLDLDGCGLQPEGLEEVIKGVQVNTKLETLVLSWSTIDNETASCLGMMLKENNTLKELNFKGLQPEGLEEVMKGVQVNTKLETLDLSHNTIDNKRALCLGMMLNENNTLKELYLEECELQPEGLEEVIKGVQVNTKLETLVLSYNTIDNKRASCLGMMLKENNTLKVLDLDGCGLQPEGLEEVIKGVQVNTKLETLVLSWSTIDNKRASCLETRQVVVIVLRLVIVEEYQVRLKKTPKSKHKVVPRLIAGY